MQKKLQRQLFLELSQAIGERRFLRRLSRSKKSVLALLRDENWAERIALTLTDDGCADCDRILAACAPTLARLSPAAPEEGWLSFTFRYAADTLFPDPAFAPRRQTLGDGALFLLALLQVCFDAERRLLAFDPLRDIALLSEETLATCDRAEEYRRFLLCWRQEFIYEMLRLGQAVTPRRALEHIAGVHRLAMAVARGLRDAGEPVDLALVSGAAAAHDLGKFGCKPGERVPYLHYYYTGRWCRERALPAIGHIAANHSVWDLELENLSVESLTLIYADFRVKQAIENGRECTRLYSLAESFDVILNKLDAVDDAKRRRYEFVYAKLRDFEDYLRALGVAVEPDGVPMPPAPKKDVALMSPEQAVEALKLLSVEHNFGLMHRLGHDRQFGNILEAARSEKKWKNLRAYLCVFEEYAVYLSPVQKVSTLGFLYELLMHREGDIRRQAAALMGDILARFTVGYRKELPADARPDPEEPTAFSMWERYLRLLIWPDHKLTPQHKSRIGYTLKIVVSSVLERCEPADRRRYLDGLLPSYFDPAASDNAAAFVLLDTLFYLPLALCDDEERRLLVDFSCRMLLRAPLELRVAALRALRHLADGLPDGHPLRRTIAAAAQDFVDDESVTLVFLRGRLLRAVGEDCTEQEEALARRDITADLFLDNLKTATPWMVKAVNIKLLLDSLESGDHTHLLHIAAHFSNLIKVSERIAVRHDAGAALLRIAPLLSPDQRNEIAVELARGLEVGEYEFSKYIPEYLGAFALWLPPEELDELIDRLGALLTGANERIVSVTLSTVGALLARYPAYRARFPQPDEPIRLRRERLLGMLLKGLADDRESVRQDALMVFGQGLFGSSLLDEHEKRRLFTLAFKKFLFLLCERRGGELTFYYRAAALNHVYRFITEQTLRHGGFSFEPRTRIAFFPGTFDPFTLSHKGIVREIRDLGFEVLLALDEFSWSKKTQPRLIRRQIVTMSVADEFHVHLFPDDFPVNLANPADLRRLREAFPGRDIYMVVGSDVVANASSYQAPPTPDSIHHMNHIVFAREGCPQEGGAPNDTPLSRIDGELLRLKLPLHLEEISSTRIRENIDLNRDISNLIDPAAQEFIYANGLYLREPQDKPVLRALAVSFDWVERPDSALLDELAASVLLEHPDRARILASLRTHGDRLAVIRSGEPQRHPVGFASLRELGSADLFFELQSAAQADAVRRCAAGKILLLTGLYAAHGSGLGEIEPLLLTEVLADALVRDCVCALFHPVAADCPSRVLRALERQGFVRLSAPSDARLLLTVDLRAPIVLIQNLETTLKEPFCSNARVLAAGTAAHHRLQTAITGLCPGSLVLSLSAEIIHHRLVDKITALNAVPSIPVTGGPLGPAMCVPFGKILRGKAVPNTVTKTLHTDKVYEPDLRTSRIEAFPYYSPLETQIRTIKSFARPVILVDDLLHAGDRMLALDPLFRQEKLDVHAVLVGLLSGRGRDLMAIAGRPVDSVYFVSNLRQWFVESTLYPFIGGDTVRRAAMPVSGLQASINQILPYAAPKLADDCPPRAVFELSLVCIENARDILLALEAEYRALFGRNLTLSRLSEAVILPLVPDKGGCIAYDPHLAASVYLENDLELLLRTQK